MTNKQFEYFNNFRNEFKTKVQEWSRLIPNLPDLQKQAAEETKTPYYPLETPIVYNKALDEITKEDDIRLIVIADNPGKDEQLIKNNKYLVGQAGKLAQGYFERNSELGIDFRKNVIILNKTPIHSAKTAHLRLISKLGGESVTSLINETQIWMAKKTAELHKNLCCTEPKPITNTNNLLQTQNIFQTQFWLVGYSELKNKGIFELYRETLKSAYNNSDSWNNVYVFQHFSMNRFTCDLNDFLRASPNKKSQPLANTLKELGTLHKEEIFKSGQ